MDGVVRTTRVADVSRPGDMSMRFDVAGRNEKAIHPIRGYGLLIIQGMRLAHRPLISEPITFSLSAFGPRVSATEPERTSSMMP